MARVHQNARLVLNHEAMQQHGHLVNMRMPHVVTAEEATRQKARIRVLLPELASRANASRALKELRELMCSSPNFALLLAEAGGLQKLVDVLQGDYPALAKSDATLTTSALFSQLTGEALEQSLAAAVSAKLIPTLVQLAAASKYEMRVNFCITLSKFRQTDEETGQFKIAYDDHSIRLLISMLKPPLPSPLDGLLPSLLAAAMRDASHDRLLIRKGRLTTLADLFSHGEEQGRFFAGQLLSVMVERGATSAVVAAGCVPHFLARLGQTEWAEGEMELFSACMISFALSADGTSAMLECGAVAQLLAPLRASPNLCVGELAAFLLSALFTSQCAAVAGAAALRAGAIPILLNNLARGTEAGHIGSLTALLSVAPSGLPALLAAGGPARLAAILQDADRPEGAALRVLQMLMLLVTPERDFPDHVRSLRRGLRTSLDPEGSIQHLDSDAPGTLGHDPDRQRAALVQAGVVEAIVAALSGQKCSPPEELCALDVLRHVAGEAADGVGGAKAVVKAGALEAVLARSWDGLPEHQHALVFLLRKLASQQDGTIHAALRESRAVAFLVRHIWGRDAYLQAMCWRAFVSMWESHDGEDEADYFRALDAAGGAAAVLFVAVDGPPSLLAVGATMLCELVTRPECEFGREELLRLRAWPLLERVVVPEGVPGGDALFRGLYGQCMADLRAQQLASRAASGGASPPPSLAAPACEGDQEGLNELLSRERDRVLRAVQLCEAVSFAMVAQRALGVLSCADLLAGLHLASNSAHARTAMLLRAGTTSERARAKVAAVSTWANELLRTVQYGSAQGRRAAAGALRNMMVGSNEARSDVCRAGGAAVLVARLQAGLEARELRAVLGALRGLAKGADAHRLLLVKAGAVAAVLRYAPGGPEDAERATTAASIATLRALARSAAAAQRVLQNAPVPLAQKVGVLYGQVLVARHLK